MARLGSARLVRAIVLVGTSTTHLTSAPNKTPDTFCMASGLWVRAYRAIFWLNHAP
jgi:hypothetical protein